MIMGTYGLSYMTSGRFETFDKRTRVEETVEEDEEWDLEIEHKVRYSRVVALLEAREAIERRGEGGELSCIIVFPLYIFMPVF